MHYLSSKSSVLTELLRIDFKEREAAGAKTGDLYLMI